MPSAVRKYDVHIGHASPSRGPFHKTFYNDGSPDVFVNSRNIQRIGDPLSCGDAAAAGSPDVFANVIPVHRVDDATTGHGSWVPNAAETGSDDVFVNEPGENIGGVFAPDNPYKTTFVKKLIAETGNNAPHDDPDSEVIAYKTPADTLPGDVDETKPADQTPGKVDSGTFTECGDFETDPVNYNQRLSANFAIKDFTLNTLWVHSLVAQNGLSIGDIICNLKGLSENILEPLRVKYPGFRINSGFRKGTGTSQHNRGMACDLQWPGLSPAGYTPIANWIRDNLPFDQLIFEHGNSIWLHISYNRTTAKQRNQLLTYYPQVTPNYKPGLTNYYA